MKLLFTYQFSIQDTRCNRKTPANNFVSQRNTAGNIASKKQAPHLKAVEVPVVTGP